MTVFLDVVLLLVIAKEGVQLGPVLSFPLWGTYIVALPYFVGMATTLQERPRFLRNPVRGLVAQGVTLTSAMLFVNLLAYRGLATAFWGIFFVTLLASFTLISGRYGRLIQAELFGILNCFIMLQAVWRLLADGRRDAVFVVTTKRGGDTRGGARHGAVQRLVHLRQERGGVEPGAGEHLDVPPDSLEDQWATHRGSIAPGGRRGDPRFLGLPIPRKVAENLPCRVGLPDESDGPTLVARRTRNGGCAAARAARSSRGAEQ